IKADARALLSTYVRALRYGAVDKDEVDKYVKELPSYGFTQREVQLITRAMQLEEAIIEAKENMREYIPTPASLATIAEYVPKARELFNAVAAARRIPEEWRPVWESYVDVRPIINEVKRYLSMSEDLYVYFAVTEDAYKKVLEQVKAFGYTDKEVELMLASAKQERYLRAWRELVGEPDRLTTLSEYSPLARDFAIGQLHKMIDAMPVDAATKNTLKAMWEQFIRVRPVYDEVRRYVTELITDFVEDVITEADFINELNALKEWGLGDDEIMFYKAIAGMRKARRLKRRG
ncbi:MAG: hypothetical protein QW651_08110, partial [Candidatus Nezhaarchaeales archaeon]